MKKTLLVTLAAIAALATGLSAQDVSFDSLYRDLPSRAACPSGVTAPTVSAPAAVVAPAPVAVPAAEREWLVLVFVNGRNNLWPAAVADVNEMETVGSTDKVAVAVELGLLRDRGTSARFLVQKDTQYPVADLVRGDHDVTHIISQAVKVPNADMGSWKHLVDFAKWSIRRYPAKKVMVILWNHGSGRLDIGGADNSGAELGIAYDDTTRNFIRNKQIAMALGEIRSATGKKVDVLDTDACLMQMASVAYELKDVTDFVVGSEEIVPGQGLPYDTVLAGLTADPGMSPEQLSRMLVKKFDDFYEASGGLMLDAKEGTTLSALRTSASADFVKALNTWVAEAKKPANIPALKAAMAKTLAFEYAEPDKDGAYNALSRDLYDFVLNVTDTPDISPKLKAKGIAFMRFIDGGSYVIASESTGPGPSYARAKGIAVYVPKLIYDPSYDETMFARDSLWDDLIKILLGQEQ